MSRVRIPSGIQNSSERAVVNRCWLKSKQDIEKQTERIDEGKENGQTHQAYLIYEAEEKTAYGLQPSSLV